MRYNREDVDCILCFSGGTESVALLTHLLNNNRKPYIFYYQWHHNPTFNKYHQHQIQKIKKFFDVEVITWNIEPFDSFHGFSNREKTKEWYINNTYNGKVQDFQPSLAKWSAIAWWINYSHPWISEIFWGMNYGGLVKFGDNLGDRLYNFNELGVLEKINPYTGPMDKSNYDDRHKNLFKSYIEWLQQTGIESNFITPLGHLTKLQQYKMIPKEIQSEVFTCNVLNKTQLVDNKSPNRIKCNECKKCTEFNTMIKAYKEGL